MYVKPGPLSWIAPVFLLLASSQLFAQSSVESRVQKLEETIRVLERRVASLEDQQLERNTPAPVASGKVNWRKLQKGMSQDDVEQLLGGPSKVNVLGPIAIWYYGYPSGGQVTFDANTRTVEGWQEP